MNAIAHERLARPDAPGFFATAWDVFVGFLLAAISVGVVAVAALAIGFVGRDGTAHARRAANDWPFPHSGVWSVAANIVVTAGVLLACAAWITARVGARAEQSVSIARVFAILGVTGYAPYVAYRGLLPLHFILGLLATTFLVRRYAVGALPLDLSPRARLGLLAAGASLLCIPAAYGATHPLWYESQVVGATSTLNWSTHRGVYHPRTDQTVKYSFVLTNSGFAKVTLLDVSGASTPLIRVVGAGAGFVYPGDRVRAVRGTSLGRHREQVVTLFIRLLGCDHASGTAALDRVNIRYRLAGMDFTQPLLLAIRPTLVCPG
jgi:hypothetical protein